ncbi:MAG: CvpA family protein [Planctomycetota bacterium]
MIINLVIIVFVLAMAVMWSTYGLFSALLHLLVVIVAGTLAFAFWELIVNSLLIGFMPTYAWGVGLVLPFAVFLIGLRLALDNLVGGNLQFPRLVNQIVGGAVGACSGILTAGIAVVGIGFLPLPHEVAGYRPYEVNSVGDVVPTAEGGQLWLGVDSMASDFFSRLSGGAFSTATPLSHFQPDLAQQAAVHRLAKWYDPNQSLVITPGTVTVKDEGVAVFTEDRIPGVGGDVNEYLEGRRNRAAGGKLVLIQTNWQKGTDAATYDSDNILRVPPTQVRLLVDKGQGPWESVAPVGFSRKNASGAPQFYRLDNNTLFASSAGFPEIDINWVFAIPENASPAYLMLRNTRFTLPEAQDLPGRAFAPLVGSMYNPDDPNAASTIAPSDGNITTNPVGYATHKIVGIEETNALPKKVSKNQSQDVNYSGADGDAEILGGSGILGDRAGGKGNSVDRVAVSDSLAALRVEITPFTPTSSGAAQGNVQPIRFVDSAGREYAPFAYSLLMGDGRQRVRVESNGELTNNTDLPLNEFKSGDQLYVYWRVPRGITIASYRVGDATQQIGYGVQ